MGHKDIQLGKRDPAETIKPSRNPYSEGVTFLQLHTHPGLQLHPTHPRTMHCRHRIETHQDSKKEQRKKKQKNDFFFNWHRTRSQINERKSAGRRVGANPEVEAAHAGVHEDNVAVRMSPNQDRLIFAVAVVYEEDIPENGVVLEHR